MKKCRACNTIKEFSSFHKRRGNSDGYEGRCKKCVKNKTKCVLTKYTTEEYKEEILKILGEYYEVLGEYVMSKLPIKMRHSCGHVYESSPHNSLRNRTCPNCVDSNNSKLSKSIQKYLNINGITYIREYKFEDCRYKRALPFDFAIFNENNLILLIEADGEYHFKDKGKYSNLEEVRFRDNIKNNYCIVNNIPLLRIPYTDIENVGTILKQNIYI